MPWNCTIEYENTYFQINSPPLAKGGQGRFEMGSEKKNVKGIKPEKNKRRKARIPLNLPLSKGRGSVNVIIEYPE